MADGKVTVIYDGDTSGIDKANSEAQSKVSSCGSKLGSIAKGAAVAIGAAFVAAGAAVSNSAPTLKVRSPRRQRFSATLRWTWRACKVNCSTFQTPAA